MSITAPHYLLLCETRFDEPSQRSGWSFVLERIDGSQTIEAADWEPEVKGERLKLLAVVRGLEAIEGPSRVTLITPNRFIARGLRSITQWKEHEWKWERFGVMTDIKNADLWRRVERARKFHQIDCRIWNFNSLFDQDKSQPKSTAAARRVKPKRANSTASKRHSWTEVAGAVANKIISVTNRQVYGCA